MQLRKNYKILGGQETTLFLLVSAISELLLKFA